MESNSKIQLICKRNNLAYREAQLQFGYERVVVPVDSFAELQMVEELFPRKKGFRTDHWYSFDGVFEGYVYITLLSDYEGYMKQTNIEKIRHDDWWNRYHNADEETRRLMACGKIA